MEHRGASGEYRTAWPAANITLQVCVIWHTCHGDAGQSETLYTAADATLAENMTFTAYPLLTGKNGTLPNARHYLDKNTAPTFSNQAPSGIQDA